MGLLLFRLIVKNEMIKLADKLFSPEVKGWKRLVALTAGLVGIGLVTFLSLRSSPAISTVGWIPKPIAHWADRNGRLDNLPAYGLLAVPFLLVASTFRRQLWMVILLALLIVALELTQLDLPTRHCDPGDIACGWTGLLVAWAGCAALQKMFASFGTRPNGTT